MGRYGDNGHGETPVPPLPDPVRDWLAVGAVIVESRGAVHSVRFLDRLDVPRFPAGDEALDLAYKAARSQATGETTHLGAHVDDSGELVALTIGSQGPASDSFEMKMTGGDVRQWAADRLGITRWVRIGPSVEISA